MGDGWTRWEGAKSSAWFWCEKSSSSSNEYTGIANKELGEYDSSIEKWDSTSENSESVNCLACWSRWILLSLRGQFFAKWPFFLQM